MVDGEIPKREVVSAPGADALLLAEQRVLVGPVVRQRYDVSPLRNIVSPHGLEQQLAFLSHARLDELARERRQVDADPLATQAVAQPHPLMLPYAQTLRQNSSLCPLHGTSNYPKRKL